MSYDTPHHLRPGGDPRTLPDYAALRDELNKLSHPARPDVNWRYAEKLCLSLFEHNGIELQTAAWYTFTRTQLAGLYGLNEGLAILEALITRQWGSLWPQTVHARIEILSGLSKRLQQTLRTLTLTYADLSPLYQAERHLTTMGDALQRLELRHMSQLDTLRALVHSAAVRLENSESETGKAGSDDDLHAPADIVHTMPAGFVANADPQGGNDGKTRWVFVAQPEPNVTVVTELPARPLPWKAFSAGVVSMLVVGSAAVWGRQCWHQPAPVVQQLQASLTPLPAALSAVQLQVARQENLPAGAWLQQTQRQLARLEHLPPDAMLRYGSDLAQQAQTLWPDNSGSRQLVQYWQRYLETSAVSTDSLEGWHQGMAQLQQLTRRLNGLDEQHGKYMTVSELKSQVFAITQAFSQTPPAEELLRQSEQQTDPAPVLLQQTELHLNQLLARYTLLKNQPDKTAP
ncbi:VasL domain-containing protein [Citrobacter werkmanii]|uniref:VasL domain-containing protein n=1 Tax=Citrobacter werkmanii TaxID=67827 RepID=UPI002654F7D9|nr:VasL domain-containing protein [Citrobacter werkmanii]MDN8559121.1 VasL domain-containing protein [Citrobacter werkmanii]